MRDVTDMTGATRRTIAVSWDELHRQTRALARNLSRKAAWAGIVAVARGGLVPAAIAARELGVRRVETLCVASYDDRQGCFDPERRGPHQDLRRHRAGW
jgi:xanthine phosphoribosyltransferase